MKSFIKTSCIAALALTITSFGAIQARAGGWGIAGGVVGGLAVGTAIGVSVASAAPVYYSPAYAAPAYYAPAPVPVAVAAYPPYYYGPRVVCGAPYPYYRPYAGVGFGWGPRYFRGRPYFRR
jgi:hypothetical protein